MTAKRMNDSGVRVANGLGDRDKREPPLPTTSVGIALVHRSSSADRRRIIGLDGFKAVRCMRFTDMLVVT